MKVYFISGLGADRSIFQKLTLPETCTALYIDWIPPEPGETLVHYAQRLSLVIDASAPFALVGLSFGGMLAAEISRFLKPVSTMLISSAAHRGELPFYFRWLKWLPLHRALPRFIWKQPTWVTYRLFGIKTKEEKSLFKRILQNSDAAFLQWAIHAIITWSDKTAVQNIVHIHGTNDSILPFRYVRANYLVKGGGHFMVYSRANEVSRILAQLLKNKDR